MEDNITTIGVLFGGHHTARKYRLILTHRPDTGSPKPKTYSQDIPGADGVLDLTEATTGEVKYGNRVLTVRAKAILPMDEQEALKSQILGDVHGKKLKVILDEDPEKYYYGRVTVTFPQKSHDQLYVTFSVDAEPYKMANNETVIGVDLDSSPGTLFDQPLFVENTAGTYINAIFDIPADDPQRDCSRYQDLAVQFTGTTESGYMGILFEVESGTTTDGNLRHWERYITAQEISARRVSVSTAELIADGLDITNIRHIATMGMGSMEPSSVRLLGTMYWKQAAIYNGQKSVVPVINCDTANAVTLHHNGNQYRLQAGLNQFDELLLPGGRTQLSFESSAAAHVEIRFRRGWL